jgi:hypothetical protein
VAKVEEAVAPVSAEKQPVSGAAAATDPSADEQPAAGESLATDYQPPFPDRVHLFLAPKREGRSAASNRDEAVELLGFVNVNDDRRAVLSINGTVYPVAEGESQFGVEVISIQPPAVVLQRGRQRWQASLEN